MKPQPDPSYRHRFPAEITGQAVWLYQVFSLSLRDIELLPAGNCSPRPTPPFWA
jgi:putative transposase